MALLWLLHSGCNMSFLRALIVFTYTLILHFYGPHERMSRYVAVTTACTCAQLVHLNCTLFHAAGNLAMYGANHRKEWVSEHKGAFIKGAFIMFHMKGP